MRFDLSQPLDLTIALAPDLLLMAGAMILLLASAWGSETPQRQRSVGRWSIALCVLTLAGVIYMWQAAYSGTRGAIAVDPFRWATDVLILLGAILALALSMDYLERERIDLAEAHVLILFATAGMMLLAASLAVVPLGHRHDGGQVDLEDGHDPRAGRARDAPERHAGHDFARAN